MKEIECWRLESVGYAGANNLVARFVLQAEAKKAKSAVGGYDPNIRHEIIRVYDTAVEFRPELYDTKSRRSGLAKLTDAEKAALGLRSYCVCSLAADRT